MKKLTLSISFGPLFLFVSNFFSGYAHAENTVAMDSKPVPRLALIVGVSTYRNDAFPTLPGAAEDAKKFYALLTGKGGFGFPKEHVKLLLDEQATLAAFDRAFQWLLDRMDPSDPNKPIVVVYFAGHGSQTRDLNGDEPDPWDETLVFHDSRSGKTPDLVDDILNAKLEALYARTHHVTVILDACHSGSGTRGDRATYLARKLHAFEPSPELRQRLTGGGGDAGPAYIPASFPDMVVLGAAGDGTNALETEGEGLFTAAIIQTFSAISDPPLTYARASHQIRKLVRSRAYQMPYFEGNLNREVFGNIKRRRPFCLEVTKLGEKLTLYGSPLPGMGKNAEFRIFASSVEGANTNDPGKSKATVVVDDYSGLTATARVVAEPDQAEPIAVGDLAVLVRPSDRFLKIKVRIRVGSEPGSMTAARAERLKKAIRANTETNMLVELTRNSGDFELALDHRGRLQILGSENRVRNTFPNPVNEASYAARNLWLHARQKAMLQLRGEGGTWFRDDETLQVQLVPAAEQLPCAGGEWRQAEPNQTQVIPLCHAWNIKVTLSKEAPDNLLVGGLIFSSDGSIYGFPADYRQVRLDTPIPLEPGKAYPFNRSGETFVGGLPLETIEHILVFGTLEDQPVAWRQLTQTAVTRSAAFGAGTTSALYRALDRYLQPGKRGQEPYESYEDSSWTMTTLEIRVMANAGMRGASPHHLQRDIDIRPYLPDDPHSPIARLLDEMLKLNRIQPPAFYHDWSQSSEAENLDRGIDAPRAIWYGFLKAGIPFTAGNRPLTSAEMAAPQGPMRTYFKPLEPGQDLQIGDIMVYRDESQGAGYALIVIDPEKGIAWSARTWDGFESRERGPGVGFHKIFYKRDWQKLGKPLAHRAAVWRYRRLSPLGPDQLGNEALANACNPNENCGK